MVRLKPYPVCRSQREPGPLVVMYRFGADRIERELPPMIEIIRRPETRRKTKANRLAFVSSEHNP